MDKIDLTEIRCHYQEADDNGNVISGGDDTLKSLQTIAEKVNEIIEHLVKSGEPNQ